MRERAFGQIFVKTSLRESLVILILRTKLQALVNIMP